VNVRPYAACGPPWISRMNGYLLAGSKSGGFRIQALIFFPSKLAYQNSYGSGRRSSEKSASLTFVRRVSFFAAVSKR